MHATAFSAVRKPVVPIVAHPAELMCQFEVSIPALEQAFPIVFRDYFAPELARLRQMEEDGLVTIGPEWLTVTMKGRLLIRNVCMVFDRYLAARNDGPRHSQTV